MSTTRLVDLSHVVEHGMTTYPGLPAPEIGVHLGFEESADHYAPGTEFTIGRIAMVSNTGTYLDTPGHRHRGGHDLAGLPLERCADLPAVVVDLPDRVRAFDAATFGADLPLAGAAVLLRTGWSRHWRTAHYGDADHPFLTEDGARHLAGAGAALVGIDAVNIDDTRGGERPAHTVLLGADVPVVEHLTGLAALPARGARFTAVPPAVVGLCTFPVRAFAVVSG
ncbi:cyclase family protein [Nocardioides marinquilinus]|uniref:Cyclase family protein n=1 Tax=Nocardioides marinquilinus TaxID=1210400 RepID=A0ABP9PRM6_9ACTN